MLDTSLLPSNVLLGFEDVVPIGGVDMLEPCRRQPNTTPCPKKELLEGLRRSNRDAREGVRRLQAATSCGPACSAGHMVMTTKHREFAGPHTFVSKLADHKAAEATL